MNPTGKVLFVAAGADAEGPGALDAEFEVDVVEGAIDAVKWLSSGLSSPDCVVTQSAVSDLPLDAFLARVDRSAPDVATVVVGELPADSGAATALVEADAYVPPGREATLVERVRRVVEDRRVDEAVDRHDRLARRIAAVSVAVADATDREALEAAVYDRLMEGDVYRQVWVARVDDDGEVDVTVPEGGRLGDADLRELAGGADSRPVAEAVRGGMVVSSTGPAPTRSTGASATAPASVDGGRNEGLTSAVVPFVHDGRVLGLCLVSSTLVDAFDASERELLADLGAVVGHALAALDPGGPSSRGGGMATLVHDLRNPLGIARSHVEIAREDGDAESLERVESALERVVDTIDRVAESVGTDGAVDETTVDLAGLAEEAWEPLSTASASLDVADPPAIRADRDMALRLLTNLFQNAIDHGGESVTVRLGGTEDGFFVEDDGPGIPSDDRAAVFERGYTTAEDGLGLGLAIVQSVVEAHGWTLSVAESADGGARFEVSDVAAEEAAPAEDEHA